MLRKWSRWSGAAPLEGLGRKEIRDFLDWVYEDSASRHGSNPGRTTNKVCSHLLAVISWAWDHELVDALPGFPRHKVQRDIAVYPSFRRQSSPLAWKDSCWKLVHRFRAAELRSNPAHSRPTGGMDLALLRTRIRRPPRSGRPLRSPPETGLAERDPAELQLC